MTMEEKRQMHHAHHAITAEGKKAPNSVLRLVRNPIAAILIGS